MKKIAFLAMIGSALCGAIGATCYKGLTFSLNPEMLNFLSRCFPLVGIASALFHKKGRDFSTDQIPLLLLMSLFYFSAMYTYIVALKYIPIVTASLLANCGPFWTPFIARVWLKEEIHSWVWIGIGISFIGILFVLQPGFEMFHPIAFLALGSGIFMAFAFVMNRKLSEKASHHKIVFYSILFTALFSLVPISIRGFSWPIPLAQSYFPLLLLLIAGGAAYGFQLLRAKAVSLEKASVVMPFAFFGPVFAGILGWIFFAGAPNWLFAFGALFVIGGMILILKSPK